MRHLLRFRSWEQRVRDERIAAFDALVRQTSHSPNYEHVRASVWDSLGSTCWDSLRLTPTDGAG
jgi:hypothetical protein